MRSTLQPATHPTDEDLSAETPAMARNEGPLVFGGWSGKRRKAIEALPLPGWYGERRKDLLALRDRLEERIALLNKAVSRLRPTTRRYAC